MHQLMLLELFAEAIKIASIALGKDRNCVQALILKAESFTELSKKNVVKAAYPIRRCILALEHTHGLA